MILTILLIFAGYGVMLVMLSLLDLIVGAIKLSRKAQS
jgi:hypothetical protein